MIFVATTCAGLAGALRRAKSDDATWFGSYVICETE